MPLVTNGQTVNLDIKATNNASPVIKQVAADVNGLEISAKDASKGADDASDGIMGMVTSSGLLTSALGIVSAAAGGFVAAFEFGELGAGHERLRESGQNLADGYGESLDRILAKVSEASLGTVSDMAIIESANKAMMLGVSGSAEELANLMEIAAFRGRAMGIDTTQAFDDMVRGVGRLSPMILDNLGIVVDAESTYADYAEKLGKTSGELTRQEKTQALLNKVLEEGNDLMADSGDLVLDNAAKYERWRAELENTKTVYAENAAGMAEFADAGADLLVGLQERLILTRQLREEYGIIPQQMSHQLLLMQIEKNQLNEVSAARMDGLATIYEVVDATKELAAVTQGGIDVTKEAVQGAIKVQESYDKQNAKLADMLITHDQLATKKQELINQGYGPEDAAILKLNEKLTENEQKQRELTEAMKGTLEQMLLNTAAAGLDAEGQLALARATGQIDEASYAALSAQMVLRQGYDDGRLSAEEYADKTIALKDAVARLESKGIEIRVDAIFNEMRNIVTRYTVGHEQTFAGGYAQGTQGWETVPAGYPNDTYPILLTSGERFAVIPQGVSSAPGIDAGLASGGNIYVTYAPQNSFGNENEAMNNLESIFMELLERAKANGQVD